MGLVFNLFVPGLGSLYVGRTLEGWLQLLLLILGVFTLVFLVGLAVIPAVWAWALVTSLQALKSSRPS